MVLESSAGSHRRPAHLPVHQRMAPFMRPRMRRTSTGRRYRLFPGRRGTTVRRWVDPPRQRKAPSAKPITEQQMKDAREVGLADGG